MCLNLEIFFFGNLFHCFYFFRKSNLPTNVFQIQYFRTSVAYSMTLQAFYFQLWYLICVVCDLEMTFSCFCVLTGDEVVTVKTPAFAESVTEGDVRWEKGKPLFLSLRSDKGRAFWGRNVIERIAKKPKRWRRGKFEGAPRKYTLMVCFFCIFLFLSLFSCWRHRHWGWGGVWNWDW